MTTGPSRGTVYWQVKTSNGEAEAMSRTQSVFFYLNCTDWEPNVSFFFFFFLFKKIFVNLFLCCFVFFLNLLYFFFLKDPTLINPSNRSWIVSNSAFLKWNCLRFGVF